MSLHSDHMKGCQTGPLTLNKFGQFLLPFIVTSMCSASMLFAFDSGFTPSYNDVQTRCQHGETNLFLSEMYTKISCF